MEKKYLTTIGQKAWNSLPKKHKIGTQLHHLSLDSSDTLIHGLVPNSTASTVMIL